MYYRLVYSPDFHDKHVFVNIDKLAECTHRYCEKIRQILTFHISVYSPNSATSPIIRHTQLNSTEKLLPRLEPKTLFKFVTLLLAISSQKQVFFFCPVLSYLIYQLLKLYSRRIEPRAFFRHCDLCYCNFLSEANNLLLAPFF
jgi:hypothetical protein